MIKKGDYYTANLGNPNRNILDAFLVAGQSLSVETNLNIYVDIRFCSSLVFWFPVVRASQKRFICLLLLLKCTVDKPSGIPFYVDFISAYFTDDSFNCQMRYTSSVGVLHMGEVEELEEDLSSVGIRLSEPALAALAIIFGVLVIALDEFHSIFIATFFIIQGTIMFLRYYGARQKKTKTVKQRAATT